MCSDGWNHYPKNYKPEDIVKCPDCNEDVDEDGFAMCGCNWSPVDCKTCGSAPCDLSC
jgi:hypothetical protein